MSGNDDPVSLYWHIPFCSQKCGYCHFYVLPDKESLKVELLQGLALEWQLAAPLLSDRKIISIYFGGGTPALFGPERIGEVLSWIRYSAPCEVTLEANPEELTPDMLSAYAAIGINRLSIGVQSLDDTLLSTLTRKHSAQKAKDIVQAAADLGFDNITIDLMYDVPGQTLATWRSTLQQAVKLPITHLSLYNLTIEPHTQFFKDQEKLKPSIPDSNTSLLMYEEAVKVLEGAGLKQYEVSAFAKEGYQSIHNSGYWTGRSFYGFGPSAFSYWEGRRFRNVANQKRYIEALQSGRSPIDFEEELTVEAQRRELLVIQLRLVDGVDLAAFTAKHGPLEASTQRHIQDLISHGLIIQKNGRVLLSARGRLCYDAVATELI